MVNETTYKICLTGALFISRSQKGFRVCVVAHIIIHVKLINEKWFTLSNGQGPKSTHGDLAGAGVTECTFLKWTCAFEWSEKVEFWNLIWPMFSNLKLCEYHLEVPQKGWNFNGI